MIIDLRSLNNDKFYSFYLDSTPEEFRENLEKLLNGLFNYMAVYDDKRSSIVYISADVFSQNIIYIRDEE